MTPQQVQGEGRRWLPWVMAVTGMLVLLVSNGLTATALSVYDESLLNEFGWSRGELKFRDLVTFWLIGLIAPFAGALIDRLGPRRMLAFGFAKPASSAGNASINDSVSEKFHGLITPTSANDTSCER